MNKIFKTLAPVILLAAVVLFTVLGIQDIKAQKTYTETTGVITSITEEQGADADKTDYHVWVSYTVDGESYQSELGSYSSSMKKGDEVAIRYNPENPNDIVQAGVLGVILMFGMAGIALIACVVMTIKKLNGRG